jgi:hypothetical protein
MKTKTIQTTHKALKARPKAISRFTRGVKTGMRWLKKIKNKEYGSIHNTK